MNEATGPSLPSAPGSYRWWYVDATQGGVTVVAIFMIGSLFSPRFGRTSQPQRHAAVNFALYEHGVRRTWVLSEYPSVTLEDGTLRIGASTFRWLPNRRVEVVVNDRTTPWGRPFEAAIELEAVGPGLTPLRLVDGLSHFWHPISPRSRARVTAPGIELEADAYHDGNFGDVPLGTDLNGWEWGRTHDATATTVAYRPWVGDGIVLTASEQSISVSRQPVELGARTRTGWGLEVPCGALLESSPFYARVESERRLSEVANFRRFQSPWIRWMARMRTRVERAA